MLRLLRNLLGRRTLRRDVDDEIRDAFETLVEERMRAGLSDAEARREATLAFGRVESVTAQVMDVRAGAFWDPLWQDIRFGARMLMRRPLFVIFAVSSLALAIGATAAIFTLFDRLVLRRCPSPIRSSWWSRRLAGRTAGSTTRCHIRNSRRSGSARRPCPASTRRIRSAA